MRHKIKITSDTPLHSPSPPQAVQRLYSESGEGEIFILEYQGCRNVTPYLLIYYLRILLCI